MWTVATLGRVVACLALVSASQTDEASDKPVCMYLGTQEYSQHEVPRDASDERLLNGIRSAYTASEKILGVSDVRLEFEGASIPTMEGDTLPKPGRYGFSGTIEHEATEGEEGREKSCFELTVVVVDVDECALGSHSCGKTAECVNTHGSFECASHDDGADTRCLHLGTQTYPQDEAPHDDEALAMLSGDILRLFEDKRGLLAVKHRAKHYEGGQIHQKPGMYTLKETIEHSPDAVGRTHTCVELTVVITDVDECTYTGKDDGFRAVCGPSTTCRNSDGSYACECPLGKVANFDDSTVHDNCRFSTDSRQCCGDHGGLVGARTLQVYQDWVGCTREFTCSDPCSSGHCVPEAQHGTCHFTDPRNGGVGGTSRQCGCAEGFFGTGVSCGPNQKQEKRYTQEVFDREGVMVWPEASPKPCGCQKLEMNPCWGSETWGPGGPDPCSQATDYKTVTNLTCYPVTDSAVSACTHQSSPAGAKCCCANGFVIKELEGGLRICEDPTPPRMTLNGAPVITLNECEQFNDPSVTIHDDNKDLYRRTRITSYDPPLRESCVTPGTYNATYQLVFRNAPPNETRLIVVKPRDSCAVNLFAPDGSITNAGRFVNPKSCPSCGTNICVPDAKCQGDGRNNYACVCPPDMRGDGMWARPAAEKTAGLRGFDRWWDANLPGSFAGGTGCTDAEPPLLTLLGQPRVDIKLCACAGCSGVVSGDGGCGRSEAFYAAEVKKAVEDGAYCEEGPPCLSVTDNRDHEISVARVNVDPPRPISGRQDGSTAWAVKYSVTDRSGNYAEATRIFTFTERSLEEHLRDLSLGAVAATQCNTAELEAQLEQSASEVSELRSRAGSLTEALEHRSNELSQKAQDVSRLEAEIAELRGLLEDSQTSDAAQQLREKDAELNRRIVTVTKLESENTELRDKFQMAQDDLRRLKAELGARENESATVQQQQANAQTREQSKGASTGRRHTDNSKKQELTGRQMTFIVIVLSIFAGRVAMY